MADDEGSAFDAVLKPLRKRHGKKGMNLLKALAVLIGIVMVVGFLAAPDPWNAWILAGGVLLLIFSPFLVLGGLEIFSIFASRRYATWKMGIGKPSRIVPSLSDPQAIRRRLNNLSPREFEHEVASLLQSLGYKSKAGPGTGDFGADVEMWDAKGTKWVVQAKKYKKPVGRPTVQYMLSVMGDKHADRAMVVTTSSFTRPARLYAESRGIKLVNGEALVEMFIAAKRA